MADVAVVAYSRKSFGAGLPELRRILALEGVTDPLWYGVKKSRRAPKYARRAAAKGADVMFVWGGDGTIQRCIDAVADTDTAVAILPAGTANLLAANLNVPHDLAEKLLPHPGSRKHHQRTPGPNLAGRMRGTSQTGGRSVSTLTVTAIGCTQANAISREACQLARNSSPWKMMRHLDPKGCAVR